jgi:hypothetical protein
LFTLLTRPKAFKVQLRLRWKAGFLGGICTAGSYGLALWAMTVAPIALVAGLRETSVIFGTVFACLFLKERFGVARYAAAILVTAGAVAIRCLTGGIRRLCWRSRWYSISQLKSEDIIPFLIFSLSGLPAFLIVATDHSLN